MADIMIARTHPLTVDESKLNETVQRFVFMYGLKQLLNDAGSTGKTPDEKLQMAMKKLDAMYAGELRTASGKAAVDPVTAEARRMAWEVLSKAIRASGKKVKDVSDEKRAELVDKYLDKFPETMDKAAEAIAARAAVPTVDLTDIL